MSQGYAARPWLRAYPEEVSPTLTIEDVALYDFLRQSAERYGDATATVFYGARLSYRQLYEQARRVAGGLINLGVKKGDRVAIMLPNCPQAVIAYYGALMAGAVVVQVNPLYMPRELKHQVGDSGARVMIAIDLAYPKVSQLALEQVIYTGLQDYMPAPVRWIAPLKLKPPRIAYRKGVMPWSALVAAPPITAPVPVTPAEDLALLQYTGATTGLPKGCMLTHRNLVANVMQTEAWLYRAKRGPELVTLAALPFFHVYGMTTLMNFTIRMGGTMVLQPKFEPREALKLIQRYRPSIFPGAPTMYVGINHLPDVQRYRLDSIEACISGAAPLPVEVQTTFERLTGGRLVEGYGLTEASPVTHANPIWGRRKEGSIGLPWPETECRIVDPETGEDVPVGEVGELLIRGPQVMKGYWNQPEATAEALRDGWLHTGDMARMDEEGYFYIADRKKDLIIAGGFNIYPREVEEVLYLHRGIKEAAVVGVPHEYRGETVKAYIVPREGYTLDPAEIMEFCRQHLAAYKIPRIIEFREELPKSIVGKVLRRVLLEEEQGRKEVG
ncbi:long-chain acyl-CoA synthetase [Symbiobacterium terraclitae]|uniref:Long-chain acyl-CoA synthetase n=1 Tax=Symbiobacterium terraclitae TaxID=557451 RepID=A0ABS4JPW3_9FIRM|nr:long-chain acyl-CoA synthetase [Symbiobacterium terraclitae]